MAFISALPPSAVGAARQMGRRLRARSPNTPVLVGIWRHRASVEELEKRFHAGRVHEIVTMLGDAVEQIEAEVNGTHKHDHAHPAEPAGVPHERPPLDTDSTPPFKTAP